MYDKLKNIKITNEHEPRIEFDRENFSDENGIQIKTSEHYNICLQMIPFNAEWVSECENLEEALSAILKIVNSY